MDSGDMQYSYLDHPSTDLLERFVLHRSSDMEAELVETHLLACDSCVSRAESLELEIAAMKLALREYAAKQLGVNQEQAQPVFWKKWFSVPVLSWAGAGLAACAFCLFAFLPVQVGLNAERGTAATVAVPEWRNTHLVLHDEGLQAGQLQAEVVNDTGSLIWAGTVNSAAGQVTLALPRITHTGRYYARLYTPGPGRELLDEFPFEVKFQL